MKHNPAPFKATGVRWRHRKGDCRLAKVVVLTCSNKGELAGGIISSKETRRKLLGYFFTHLTDVLSLETGSQERLVEAPLDGLLKSDIDTLRSGVLHLSFQRGAPISERFCFCMLPRAGRVTNYVVFIENREQI